MKKGILVITLFFTIVSVFGQKDGLEYGIKAGLNYSTFRIDSKIPAEFNGSLGFHAGGYLRYNFATGFYIKPELLFSTQVANYSLSDEVEIQDPNDPFFQDRFKADIKESLLILPVMLEYTVSENFSLELGPQLGYVLSQNISDNNEVLDFEVPDDAFEIAANFGILFSFTPRYKVGIRYNYAFVTREGLESSVVQLSLAYKL